MKKFLLVLFCILVVTVGFYGLKNALTLPVVYRSVEATIFNSDSIVKIVDRNGRQVAVDSKRGKEILAGAYDTEWSTP